MVTDLKTVVIAASTCRRSLKHCYCDKLLIFRRLQRCTKLLYAYQCQRLSVNVNSVFKTGSKTNTEIHSKKQLWKLIKICRGPKMQSFHFEAAVKHWYAAKKRQLSRLFQPSSTRDPQ